MTINASIKIIATASFQWIQSMTSSILRRSFFWTESCSNKGWNSTTQNNAFSLFTCFYIIYDCCRSILVPCLSPCIAFHGCVNLVKGCRLTSLLLGAVSCWGCCSYVCFSNMCKRGKLQTLYEYVLKGLVQRNWNCSWKGSKLHAIKAQAAGQATSPDCNKATRHAAELYVHW